MKRLLFAVVLLLVGAHAHAQTSEAEVQADVLAIEIATAVKAERLTDAAKLLEEYAALGVTMPPPLILQRAVVYFKLERFEDAEVQLKDYLKKSERGSEDYKRAVLMLVEVKPKAKAAAEAKLAAAKAKAEAAAAAKRAAAAAKQAAAAAKQAAAAAKQAAAKAKADAEAKRAADAEAKRVAAEAKVAAQRLGESFKDCLDCPEMVIVRTGSFMMGSPTSEAGRSGDEGPRHRVTVGEYAVGKYEVTFDEWEAYRRAKGRAHNPEDRGWGRGKRPVINVSWDDAKKYIKWLSKKTGKDYRLLSESEWEDAARATTTTPFHTGQTISTDQANDGRNHGKTLPVGSFPANHFGLHDMHGNVSEWVEDCWHDDYDGAPSNGSAWTKGGDCALRVLRGGSWINGPRGLRSAYRDRNVTAYRGSDVGFRVARVVRTLTP